MTETEALDYLETRAMRHGMTAYDLLEMTPASVADCPREACVFWEGKDISHINLRVCIQRLLMILGT